VQYQNCTMPPYSQWSFHLLETKDTSCSPIFWVHRVCNLLYCWSCTKLGTRNWEWNKNREYKKRNETSPVCGLCSGRPMYANQYQCCTRNTLNVTTTSWDQQSKLQIIQSQHLCANYSCVLWHNFPNPQIYTLYNWQADTPKQLLTLTATTCISTPV